MPDARQDQVVRITVKDPTVTVSAGVGVWMGVGVRMGMWVWVGMWVCLGGCECVGFVGVEWRDVCVCVCGYRVW